MKIKDGFELREVCGENVILSSGMENIDFSKIISLNESAAFLWKTVLGKEFTEEMMVEALLGEYDVDRDTAAKDVSQVVASWREIGLID